MSIGDLSKNYYPPIEILLNVKIQTIKYFFFISIHGLAHLVLFLQEEEQVAAFYLEIKITITCGFLHKLTRTPDSRRLEGHPLDEMGHLCW